MVDILDGQFQSFNAKETNIDMQFPMNIVHGMLLYKTCYFGHNWDL